MNVAAVIDVIARSDRQLCATFVPATVLEGVVLALGASGTDYLAYRCRAEKLIGSAELGWGLISTKPPAGYKRHIGRLQDVGLGQWVAIPADGIWALVAVLTQATAGHTASQIRVSSGWAALATNKIPLDRLPDPDKYLDLSRN